MDHLYRLVTNDASESSIYDYFPDKQLFKAQVEPWFADIVNYLLIGEIPGGWNKDDRDRFMFMARFFMWANPFLNIVRTK